MPSYQHVTVPTGGHKIPVKPNFSLEVPDQPIVPYIEGDGTGVDITPVMIKVVDAAVAKAYGGKRKIHWMEIYAGEKSTKVYGADVWLPDETLSILKDYVVSIKGPLTTPVGGGIRSLNVALRQQLDLYVCLRPIQYFNGVPSPVKAPEKVYMQKCTEGGVRDWAYAVEQQVFGAQPINGRHWRKCDSPKAGGEITLKDAIADAFLQQIMHRPEEYSVIATLNVNGDYISDAL